MKALPILVLAAGLLLAGCGDSSKQSRAGAAVSNVVTAPVEYLGAAGRAKQLAERTADTLGVSQAVQMFVAQEGRYPKSLDELVEQQFLTQLPKAPPGMKFHYDPPTGRVTVVKDDPPPASPPK